MSRERGIFGEGEGEGKGKGLGVVVENLNEDVNWDGNVNWNGNVNGNLVISFRSLRFDSDEAVIIYGCLLHYTTLNCTAKDYYYLAV